MTDCGAALVSAIAAKDHGAVRAVLAPDVDFRGLTPGRPWEASTSDGVVEILFGSWFDDHDDIVALLAVDEGVPVEDTERVSYRLALRTPDGDFTAEQQAYYRSAHGRITHLRMLCSGFRPASPRAEADHGRPTA